MRINRAGDDAAGLAISEKMRGQIRGLKQAQRNAQDGISLIQTAEGALNETHAILQRMRELAVQSATDTNTEVDRGEIQKEIDELAAEITRIAETTEFNTQNLLGGSFKGTFHIGANEGQDIILSINKMDATALSVAGNAGVTQELSGETVGVDVSDTHLAVGTYNVQKLGEKTAIGGVADQQYVLRNGDGYIVGSSADGTTWTLVGDDATLTKNVAEVDLGTSVGWDVSIGTGFDAITTGQIEITEIDSNNYAVINAKNTLFDGDSGLSNGEYTVVTGHAGTSVAHALVKASNPNEIVAVSADLTAWTTLDGEALFSSASALVNGETYTIGSDGGIDVSSQESASAAITIIDAAIEDVSAERSKLGAYQNRLEHTIANLGTSAENLQAAESRIRDLDMAEEIMAFTKNNILQQAATAMLAQANMAPQSVLQLLG